MGEIVDTRGLVCPQPVLLTLSKMRDMETGEIDVWLDTEASRKNVTRAARKQGWGIVADIREADGFHLVLKRS